MKLLAAWLIFALSAAAAPIVAIQDTINNQDGTPFIGILTIKLNQSCYQDDGQYVSATTPTIVEIGTGSEGAAPAGELDVALYPNATGSCGPPGVPADEATSYSVRYEDTQNPANSRFEYWSIPTGGPYRIMDVMIPPPPPTPGIAIQPHNILRGGANIGDPMCFNDTSVWGPGTCGGGGGGGGNPSQPFTSSIQVDAVHNCGTLNVLGMVLGSDDMAFEPDTFQPLDSNTVRFTFAVAETGRWVVNCGATGESGNYTQNFTSQTTVTVTHNRNTQNVLLQIFNGSGMEFEAETVRIVDVNTVELTFAVAETGTVVVNGG